MDHSSLPTDPPRADELEVSVFGPGVGECVVVHLGQGKWMIVDSCLDPLSRTPIALKYLQGLGVDLKSAVHAIVASHWHDDHTRGLTTLFGACQEATFFCSAALNTDEGMRALSAASDPVLKVGVGSGFDELAGIFMQLNSNQKRQRFCAPEFLIAATTVMQNGACKVQALSPSSAAHALTLFALVAPTNAQPMVTRRVVPRSHPNDLAVVLHVEFGSIAVLLGADLEKGSQASSGWQAIVGDRRFAALAAADIVKVAHHGSVGADLPGAWAKLVSPNASAAVTPFRPSGLPRPEDIDRIKARGIPVYLTAPKPQSRARLDSASEKTLDELSVQVRERSGSRMGQIRFRSNTTGPVQVSCFGAAMQV
jgi:beta-lactamase superfamily II metal-dependent hydrolase